MYVIKMKQNLWTWTSAWSFVPHLFPFIFFLQCLPVITANITNTNVCETYNNHNTCSLKYKWPSMLFVSWIKASLQKFTRTKCFDRYTKPNRRHRRKTDFLFILCCHIFYSFNASSITSWGCFTLSGLFVCCCAPPVPATKFPALLQAVQALFPFSK